MTEVIKVTSKGQITIPANIRKKLQIGKDSYVAVDTVGDYIIMKKVGLKLKEISDTVYKAARDQGITEKDIREAIAGARREVWA